MLLPERFFFDSNTILSLMNNSYLSFTLGGDSYNATAFLFKSINIFGFSSLVEWSIFISFFTDLYILYYFKKNKISTKLDLIIAWCFLVLLNIFVFNLSKDILQFIVFTFVYHIIKNKKIPDKGKHFLVILAFVFESVFFRSYYILTAIFYICATIGLPVVRKIEKKGIIFTILSIAVVLYAFLFISSFIMPEEYNKLINIRNRLTLGRIGAENASTLIVNLISDNGNLLLYIANYFLNALRMLFPFELLTKGYLQIAFMCFQLICTLFLLRKIKNYNIIKNDNDKFLNVMIAYFLTAFVFEPDFGSFVRHEAATFTVLFQIMTNNTHASDKTEI